MHKEILSTINEKLSMLEMYSREKKNPRLSKEADKEYHKLEKRLLAVAKSADKVEGSIWRARIETY